LAIEEDLKKGYLCIINPKKGLLHYFKTAIAVLACINFNVEKPVF